MCWASCSLRYWDRRTCNSESLRGDSASAASTHRLESRKVGGLQGRVSDPGIMRMCVVLMARDTLQDFGWTWTMTSCLHVTTSTSIRVRVGVGSQLPFCVLYVRVAPKKKKLVEEQASK
jgi:hypothetical protein